MKVPAELRTAGLTVSFLNADGNTEKWEFSGGSWEVSGFSKVGAKIITKLVNEFEDLSNSTLCVTLSPYGFYSKSQDKITLDKRDDEIDYGYSQIIPITKKTQIKLTAINSLSNVVTILYLDNNMIPMVDISVTTCEYNNELIQLNNNASYFAISGKVGTTKCEFVNSKENNLINIGEVYKYISDLKPFSLVLVGKEVFGKYLNESQSYEPADAGGWMYYDYIEVVGGKYLQGALYGQSGSGGVVFYDADKAVIGSYGYSNEISGLEFAKFILPEEAKYMRISCSKQYYPFINLQYSDDFNTRLKELEGKIDGSTETETIRVDAEMAGYYAAVPGNTRTQFVPGGGARITNYEYIHGIRQIYCEVTANEGIENVIVFDKYYNIIQVLLGKLNSSYKGTIEIPSNAYYVRVGSASNGFFTYATNEKIKQQQEKERTADSTNLITPFLIKAGRLDLPEVFYLFNKIVFAGDSCTFGSIYDQVSIDMFGTNGDLYEHRFSYPSVISKMYGVVTVNNGHSGQTLHGWLNNYGKTGYLDDKENVDLVVLELGWNASYNDTNGWPSTQEIFENRLNSEVVAYGDNYNSYDISSNSPIACYCKLIKKIQSDMPNVSILCIASMGMNYLWASYIRQIAEWANVAFIDASMYLPNGKDVLHFTCDGYITKARIVANLFNLAYAEKYSTYIKTNLYKMYNSES